MSFNNLNLRINISDATNDMLFLVLTKNIYILDWFKEWFDTFYYHVLYAHRNSAEAENFIDNIIELLPIQQGAKVLDLACGKGRHAHYMSKKGFDVVGIDLSENSIAQSQTLSNNHLHFHTMDMRYISGLKNFDLVINMFTSFGYFEHTSDNIKVLQSVNKALDAKRYFVIDFLNATQVVNRLVPEETQVIDGIIFKINRLIENQTVVKKINIMDGDKVFHFQERVNMFELSDFKELFKDTGFELVYHFGNYNFDAFDPLQSDRLILIAQKK